MTERDMKRAVEDAEYESRRAQEDAAHASSAAKRSLDYARTELEGLRSENYELSCQVGQLERTVDKLQKELAEIRKLVTPA